MAALLRRGFIKYVSKKMDNTWFTMYFSRASRKKAVRSSWFLSPDCGATNGVISSGVTWAAEMKSRNIKAAFNDPMGNKPQSVLVGALVVQTLSQTQWRVDQIVQGAWGPT